MKLYIYLLALFLPIVAVSNSNTSSTNSGKSTTNKVISPVANSAKPTIVAGKPATSSDAATVPTTATKPVAPPATTGKPVITVYKSPHCSCCTRWVDHLKANGFTVKSMDVENVNPYKQKAGVTPQLASCHTAFVNGYVVEGHVPASDIKRMLKQKPAIKGISVPAMPHGTPGMDMSGRKDPYDVVSFDKNGKVKVYKSYR